MDCDKKRKIIIGVLLSIVLILLIGFASAENYKVDLEVKFNDLRSNTFPCTIKICIDDNEIITTRCEGSYSTQMDVEKGRHVFWFYIANKGFSQALRIDVKNDMKVRCRVNADDAWPKIYLDKITPSSARIIPSRREAEGWHCNKCGKLSDLFFPDCVYCGNERSAHKAILSFKCKENRIFSRYDVNIYVDDVFYTRLKHGNSIDLNCYLSSGKHLIKIQKFDNDNLYVEKEIQLNNNSLSVSLDFEVKRNEINIMDYKASSKKLDDYYVSFLREKGTNTIGYSFNMDEMRFSYYSKTTPSYGKSDWSEKGSFSVDPDGLVTLVFDDGRIETMCCKAVLNLRDIPAEALLPVTNSTSDAEPKKIDDGAFMRKRK